MACVQLHSMKVLKSGIFEWFYLLGCVWRDDLTKRSHYSLVQSGASISVFS